MARKNRISFLKTTRAALNTQASAGALLLGEPYLITDEGRFAIATGTNTYQAFALQGEGGTATPTPSPTPTPTPTPSDGTFPDGMVGARWTMNGITTPIAATGTGVPAALSIERLGSAATAGTNGRMVLPIGGYLATPKIPWAFATNSDATKSRTPSKMRASFKGVVPPPNDATILCDMMDYDVGQFTLMTHWGRESLQLGFGRGTTSQQLMSDAGTLKYGTLALYEVEWVNNASGAGGTATFYVDGVQVGSPKATTFKPQFTANMVLNVNASIGNTGPSVAKLEVEYVQVAYVA